MTDYSDYHGTWTIDPSHTRLGFVARHAMVTKVRGAFDDVAGTIVIDATNPTGSSATVAVQLASVSTGSPDRDAHLRSPDFFDVEVPANKEMSFASTTVKQDGDEFAMVGDLTIKGVTRPVELQLEPSGVATDPFGNVRAGFEGSAELSRKDFGLVWNVALEAGGVLVSDRVRIQLDVSAIRTGSS